MKIKIRKNLGILGGTFDPPHKGHLYISKIAIKILRLQKLYWIITNQNPLKKTKPIQSVNRRSLLSKKIIKDNKKIKIMYKNKIANKKYTIDYIQEIKKIKKNKNLYLIIGADNLINFHKWKYYEMILKHCTLVVMHRKGYKKKALESFAAKKFGRFKINSLDLEKENTAQIKWIYLNIEGFNLSSSSLRNSL